MKVRKREPNDYVDFPMREGLSDCRRNWSEYIRGIGSLSMH